MRVEFEVFILLAGLAPAALLGGCTHPGFGSKEAHFTTFGVEAPRRTTVEVCHAYGCRMRSRVRFTETDMTEIAQLMKETRRTDTAGEERRAVAYAVGWMERRVGKAIGTSADRPGMDFEASGDPTQQDCVDEATNTTSYLTVLQNAGLLRHHTVGTPFARENYLRGVSGWTHWTAVLVERTPASAPMARVHEAVARRGRVQAASIDATSRPGQRWAVDSRIHENGENPAIVETEKWYLATLNELPASTR